MQIIPDQRNAKTTAILLLFIALLLVYLLVFHWFVMRHGEYAEELGALREQLYRFQNVASQREPLQVRLAGLRSAGQDTNLFLQEADFDEAAAAMSSRIGQMVRSRADDACQIVSRQPVRARAKERFEKVTVNVRMRCDGDDFLQILYSMETGTPLILVDELNIIRPRTQRNSRGRSSTQGTLDIRFNVSGYLQ